MSKRFIDTDIWRKKWFRSLSPEHKVFWTYLFTNCDNAGVWDVDQELAEFLIGKDIDWPEVEKIFKNHIKILNNGSKWWLIDFISFQYGQLKETCKPHLHSINLLKKHKLFIEYSKGIETVKDKDKVKVKEEDKEASQEEIRTIINNSGLIKKRRGKDATDKS